MLTFRLHSLSSGHHNFHCRSLSSLPRHSTRFKASTPASHHQMGKGCIGCSYSASHYGYHHASLPRASTPRSCSPGRKRAFVDDDARSCRYNEAARSACQGLEVGNGERARPDCERVEERREHFEGSCQYAIDAPPWANACREHRMAIPIAS